MDVRIGYFIWDINKELTNLHKHSINFTEAIEAFRDEKRKIFVDLKHSVYEERFYCLGKVDGKVLTVRFTYHRYSIRIIGAGYWRKWRKYYYEKESN